MLSVARRCPVIELHLSAACQVVDRTASRPAHGAIQGANEQNGSLVAQGVHDGCATQLTTGIPRPAQICPMAGPICPDISASVKTFPFTLLQA